jgi:DNA-binding NarL/FixJ family response regulator
MKPVVIMFSSFFNPMLNAQLTSNLLNDKFDIKNCTSFKELGQIINIGSDLIIADSRLIKNHGTVEEFMLMIENMIKFAGLEKQPKSGVGFSKDSTISDIKKIQKTSAVGVFPDIIDFGIDEFKKSIDNFLMTGKSYPKHLLQTLSGNKDKPKFKDIHLTDRQKQVYDLIADRGLSNKQIAQVLKISESTVKIHVSAIMRALCVRNRTQLALTK